MPRRAVQVVLAPRVLTWARTTAGWTVEEIAKKLQVDSATVRAWEEGQAAVSLGKLQDLTTYYKRSLAAFFLPRPPQMRPLPPDFRSLPNRQGVFSKDTWLALRRAHRLQDIAADLMQALEQSASASSGEATLSNNPEEVAIQERDRLGIDIAQQTAWPNEGQALREWREALERANILTFQLQMPVEDARGFSLVDQEPTVVAVSSKDSMSARIFTLLHEYGHIMLRSSGICYPREEAVSDHRSELENWCDHFAGAVLMPNTALVSNEDRIAFGRGASDKSRCLSRLAQKYKVSRLAMLTRLLTLGFISRDRYNREVNALKKVARGAGGGFAPHPAELCIAKKGRRFTSLVLQAVDQDVVGYSEMADYLGIRLKHADRVRALLTV